jgi:hypothetical protein
MRASLCLHVAALIAFLVPAAMADEATLAPTQDVYTSSLNSTTNYGGDVDLYLGKGTYWDLGYWRAYLEFDVSGVVGTVQDARLHLYQYDAGPAAGGLPCDAHRILGPWSEGTITWQTQPAHDGYVYDSQDVGSSGYQGWIIWNITDLVAAWVSGAQTNYGVVLKHYTESPAGASRYGIFHASESGSSPLRPKLVVQYEAPTPVAAGTWGSIKSLFR